MKTEWDYTELADAYLKRPAYSEDALTEICSRAGLAKGSRVCDVGAGAGHLTIPLAERSFRVVAVEPNDAMRANGMRRTASFPDVSWIEAGGEDTRQPGGAFDLVSFGSSFSVLDRNAALKETHRLLKPGAWFVCMWNHRDLTDPAQKKIETIIQDAIPDYQYGIRREDQTDVIRASGLFDEPQTIEGRVNHQQTIDEIVTAWRSHGTVHRQAGDKFPGIIKSIAEYLESLKQPSIAVPYTTRAWLARKKG